MENKATVIMVICCLILGAILWQVALIKPAPSTRYQIVDFSPKIRMVLDAETGKFWEIEIEIKGLPPYIKRREIGGW